MKADIAFKFVALRGPTRSPERLRGSVALEDDVTFVDLVLRRVAEGEPLAEARLAEATNFLSSARYLTRNPEWRSLLHLEDRFVTAIDTARRIGNARPFRRDLEALLGSAFEIELELEQFVVSGLFHDLHQNLWHSYYSNLMLPRRRPQDRPTLLFWIRLFALLQSLELDDELFAQQLRDLDALRPTVPPELVRTEAAPFEDDEPGEEEDLSLLAQRRDAIAALKRELEQLRTATADLQTAFRHKLHSARSNGIVMERAQPADANDYDTTRRSPWELRESDLQAVTLEVLSANGLSLAHTTAPELIHAVQNLQAEAFDKLHSAQHVEEIIHLRGTLVRRQRRINQP
jgi:hypothetical protein